MTLVHILAVPEREPLWAALRDQHTFAGHRVLIHLDPDRRGVMWNTRRAWQAAEPGWNVILDDDAWPHPNTPTHLNHILDHAPSPFVGLYGAPHKEHEGGDNPWAFCDTPWGAAVALTFEVATLLLDTANLHPDYPHDDGWPTALHRTGRLPAPAVCTNRPYGERRAPSTLGHGGARGHHKTPCDPEPLDWSQRPPERVHRASIGTSTRDLLRRLGA